MSPEEAASKLQGQFPNARRTDFRDESTLELPLDQIESACKFAKEQVGFNFLTDLSSVDNFGDEPRFEVVYELYSLDSNIHLRLKTRALHRMAMVKWSGRRRGQEHRLLPPTSMGKSVVFA